MLADDMACDPRNPRPGKIQNLFTVTFAVRILTISSLFSSSLSLSLSLSATIFNDAKQQINVYGDDIEVDYRGYEVGRVSVTKCSPHFY